ncbi:putative damage-inducible protein DinB [Shimia isoporae]|uniref:Putative damage-inducible protein DinB n=1 Tax=Shimia isoporae TaxID=647720 RepID=A0A4R1NMW4_9RHOB|nr:DinB family protein [Shimia isoporae]TCL09525.1 putative damage-inducible protein DinB [Shimia isoporae]
MTVTPAYCQMMARYNAWQNGQVRAACEKLTEAELRADRGAFFGSVMATLNHILWGDFLWMSRLDGGEGPSVPAKEHIDICPTFAVWSQERLRMDQRIGQWADRVSEDTLSGDLHWHAVMLDREMSKPLADCVVGLFNHQTHHRGQIHAMLTSLDRDPGATDLVLMPEGSSWH